MLNFLEMALKQGEEKEREEEIPFRLGTAGGQAWGTALGEKRSMEPHLPTGSALSSGKGQGGGGVEALSPLLLSLNGRGRGTEESAPLDRSQEPFGEERAVPAGSLPAALGPERMGVLERPVPVLRARLEGKKEIPLLAELRRTERAAALVRGQGRNGRLILTEDAGESGSVLSVEELDRAVERDARRYGAGPVFY